MPSPPIPSVAVLKHPKHGRATLKYVDRPDKYSHTLGAWLGYDSARFTTGATMSDLNFWVDSLGCKVEAHSPAMDKVWEGFIDEVRINVGPLAYTVGPLMDVGNQLLLIWSRTQENWDKPSSSTNYHITIPTTDAMKSQDRYGVIWKALNAGTCTLNGSADVVEKFYRYNLAPKKSWDVRSGRGQLPTVDVRCLGYVHWLNWYIDDWDDFWLSGYEYINVHISRILSANPNSSWLAIDETYLQTNASSMPDALPPDMTALEQIKEAMTWGSGSPDYQRWLFGMYNDFQVHYEQAPEYGDLEYEIHLEDDRLAVQSAHTAVGARVQPWHVKPGKWVILSDFLPGLTVSDAFGYYDDPRIGFVEEVRYTAPHALQLKGADFDRMDQFMNYWGLRGSIG